MTVNLFSDVPGDLRDELFTTLLDAANMRIERIVSQGHASPEGPGTTKTTTSGSSSLKGTVRLKFEDETVETRPREVVNILVHRRHWVDGRRPTSRQSGWLSTTGMSGECH
ncbi:MAG: phosphoribosylaminoimidazole carboxylase [Isosphaeraceae bacterium]|nr:phosphoribosylaminoimidazole carboxylase [Isosphaeraceae bacterium]